ncbi:MAG: aminotransferase class III [Candidatus Melainabacteria bacterium RIFOXYA12_FULL_32_12]|nr:MAG: aminotransferase class III [Candidatus Melainabacteria bacterium RIFOXYA2_FULL_32_9]OGI31811.1 MAG: aminotransferase class III [Candidatus Melainabacteria bacterium RIFOXYA12_FULL_32_12]
MSKDYNNSEKMLERALRSIPLGTQTFSKSKIQFPQGVSPYFIQKAQGSKVWDIDGNEYTDFMSSLAALNLGYNDSDVVYAVKKQLEEGTIFSLPHPIEVQVAEKIIEMVPCAEMVRFGKNGSDATSGAIRVARAYTGRDYVAICGYHGWQDWYIGSTTRDLGVPETTKKLTLKFSYNDIDSLHKLFQEYPDQIAAVILEPMNVEYPKNNFLQSVKDLTHKNKALLIFDETITGFRYAKGGAQEYFGVIPDLATFGKGIANGYPLSAIAGSADIMKLFEEVFFSFTFGGETLSLSAALATLSKLQSEPVLETISSQGQKVIDGINNLISKHNLQEVLFTAGHPSWNFIIIKDAGSYSSWQLKTLFLQEIFKKGIITIGAHVITYAHSNEDIEKLLNAYKEIFLIFDDVTKNNSLEKYLKCKPLEPLFKVR